MKRAKRWINSLFYVPKYASASPKPLSRMIASCMAAVMVCSICLVGFTWAWFNDKGTVTANQVTTAVFSVRISVVQNDTAAAPEIVDGSYQLQSGTYTVTVTAEGSASTGFCTVKLQGTAYHTVQLSPAGDREKPQSVTFTVYASDGDTLTITSQWGTHAQDAAAENPLIGNVADDGNHIVNAIGTPSSTPTSTQGTDNPTEPNPTQPDATQPDITEPDATQPDATQPVITEPDVTQPEAAQTEQTQPQQTNP